MSTTPVTVAPLTQNRIAIVAFLFLNRNRTSAHTRPKLSDMKRSNRNHHENHSALKVVCKQLGVASEREREGEGEGEGGGGGGRGSAVKLRSFEKRGKVCQEKRVIYG